MRQILFLVACIALASSGQARAQRPPARIPSNPDEVLERLPAGFSAATAHRPGRTAPPQQILSMLALAATTGDTRLSERAQRLLDAYPRNTPNTEIVRARAFAAQHRHDFAESLMQLERLLALSPRDGDALLSRAQIQLVQGRVDRTRVDCGRLSLQIDAGLGMLCAASLSLRLQQWTTAATFADRWLSAAGGDPALRRYGLLLRGEIASRAGEPDADRWFTHAMTLGSGDVRSIAAFSRHLRRNGRDMAAIQMLRAAPLTDTLLLEHALAAQHVQAPEVAALRAELGRRFALAHATGQPTELRDEAEYELSLQRNPARALDLALRNFESQRDAEDVELLVRTAKAARRPRALDGLRAWAASQHVPVPEADAR
ncbi:tetratricopeptide repeat protein [Lysobacter xanthus]